MSLLPETDRILLGPGPSLTAPRVMRAMASPTVSHLDPLMLRLLDDVRDRLARVFRAADGSLAFAVSGTGTSGMETAVANLVKEGTRATVVVTGYFGDRLAQMCERYGAAVTRLTIEWGTACDPERLRAELKATPADVVAMVHAETSTGVLNPVRELAAIAREHGALTIVDAVTSLGGMPLEVGAWGIDAAYSCTQKCLGGPSGLAPVVFGPRALQQRVKCRSFYFDLALLEDYWLRRKYHHTMSSTLVYALYEALSIIEEEGLEKRWARHERNHRTLVASLAELGLSLLPAESAAVEAERRARAGGSGRSGGAHAPPRRIQHGDRRRPRAARRQDLARRLDGHGRQLLAAARRAAARRARKRAREAGARGSRLGGRAGGAGRASRGSQGRWACRAEARARFAGERRRVRVLRVRDEPGHGQARILAADQLSSRRPAFRARVPAGMGREQRAVAGGCGSTGERVHPHAARAATGRTNRGGSRAAFDAKSRLPAC
jgi:alanine-glyoxylate transaminase / serine-glyoxylate transaminase / serine-pyruvate transaminase